jgi:hypothetical protein
VDSGEGVMARPTEEEKLAARMFTEAVEFIQGEYGADAELRYPHLVLAYIAARAIVTCREVELVEVQHRENCA